MKKNGVSEQAWSQVSSHEGQLKFKMLQIALVSV